MKDEGIDDKVNQAMTADNMDRFLEKRLENLSNATKESYIRGWSSLVQGFRSSESIKLLTEPDHYIVERNSELVVEGLIGKGSHIYDHKAISGDLAYKIQLIYKVPSYSTFYRDLRELGINTHGFRYTYAKETLEEKLSDEGQSYHDVLKEVSKELNHHREEMTTYYLNRG